MLATIISFGLEGSVLERVKNPGMADSQGVAERAIGMEAQIADRVGLGEV
jgi:hypothetical protein